MGAFPRFGIVRRSYSTRSSTGSLRRRPRKKVDANRLRELGRALRLNVCRTYRPEKNDGKGRSRIVCKPGAACSTLGIELTTIDAVATSPWMPPEIFIDRLGDPSMSTES